MNQKRTLNVLSPNGVGRAVIHRQLPKLVLSLAALMLLALTACIPAPVSGLVAVAAPPAEVVAADAVTENEIDPDRDIGLLESLRPQTIEEVNAPDLLQNEVDPDRDIGLLEFLRPQAIQEVRTIDQLPSSSALRPDRSMARRHAAVAEGRTHPLLGGR